ncbi:long-chain fatty acid--CoA ligase [Phocaeicola paurosaccharolyticus]|uniref:AMP-dependent synthetase/ligase n=1 Tax=Phocaeicola paurosaccharolyticus TaxID=732242 RepID=UPI002FE2C37D
MNKTLLSDLIYNQSEKYGERVALRFRDYSTESWIPVTWNSFSDFVRKAANSLIHIGVKEQENIGVFSQNKPECLYVDFGAFSDRIVTIPLYATSSETQVEYIIEDSSIEYIFVGEQFQYDVAYEVLKKDNTLKQIIIFDSEVSKKSDDLSSIYFDEFVSYGSDFKYDEEVERRIAQSTKDDLANILYTSGTTGEPKGVMLHHSCYEAAVPAHIERLKDMTGDEVVMNFLPFTHVFEKAWTYYCLCRGCEMCINLKPSDIQRTIKEIRPNLMCSVPRFWEKVYSGVQEKINSTKGIAKVIMLDAIKTGKKYNIDYKRAGKKAPLFLSMKYKLYDKSVYTLLKKTIGIERGSFFPTAGAAIPNAVEEFVHSVGINMIAGYGLTESTATVSCQWKDDYDIGSVGKLMPNVQVKIGENDEVLLKGETITKGYYKKPEATKAAFTENGWFRTGDSGYFKDGNLYLKERIKDLFKTSNGKYIAPQAIESKIVVDRYVDQIAVIADKRKFVSALIIPEYKLVEEYAKSNGIGYSSMEELLNNPKIIELFTKRIDALQTEFASYEKIKRFTLLANPFSMERGELTNTLKIKRNVLYTNYAKEIDKMYEC